MGEILERADRIWAYTNAKGLRVWTPMKPVISGAHEEQEYVRADLYADLARQAEALKRENAEKVAQIAALEIALHKIVNRAAGGTVVHRQSLEMTEKRILFLENDIRDIANRALTLLKEEANAGN